MYQWVGAPQVCPNFFSVPLKMKDALVSKKQEFPIKLRKINKKFKADLNLNGSLEDI